MAYSHSDGLKFEALTQHGGFSSLASAGNVGKVNVTLYGSLLPFRT